MKCNWAERLWPCLSRREALKEPFIHKLFRFRSVNNPTHRQDYRYTACCIQHCTCMWPVVFPTEPNTFLQLKTCWRLKVETLSVPSMMPSHQSSLHIIKASLALVLNFKLYPRTQLLSCLIITESGVWKLTLNDRDKRKSLPLLDYTHTAQPTAPPRSSSPSCSKALE